MDTVKIGILSDTHDHKRNTQLALDAFRERGITRLIHCGDITTPDIMLLFAGWQVTFVLGNMDYYRDDLFAAARMIGIPIPRLSARIEIADRRIGVTHGADHALLYRLMIGGECVYVCHGHTHRRRDERLDTYNVRVINPGALGGMQPETRSVCILDPVADTVEFIEFPELV
ncbi:MAG: YfcE family phosphodiesterase [Anaerolineae bacterium]|nr:YfcE family phosphodiesterase [Anaerolineae bacterium]